MVIVIKNCHSCGISSYFFNSCVVFLLFFPDSNILAFTDLFPEIIIVMSFIQGYTTEPLERKLDQLLID